MAKNLHTQHYPRKIANPNSIFENLCTQTRPKKNYSPKHCSRKNAHSPLLMKNYPPEHYQENWPIWLCTRKYYSPNYDQSQIYPPTLLQLYSNIIAHTSYLQKISHPFNTRREKLLSRMLTKKNCLSEYYLEKKMPIRTLPRQIVYSNSTKENISIKPISQKNCFFSNYTKKKFIIQIPHTNCILQKIGHSIHSNTPKVSYPSKF